MTISGRKRVDLANKARMMVMMDRIAAGRKPANDNDQLGNVSRPKVLQGKSNDRKPSMR